MGLKRRVEISRVIHVAYGTVTTMILVRCKFACLLLCLPLLSAAQPTTAESVAKSLKGKLVFLRGMYVENDLAFDAQGNVTGTATPGPFSVSAIRVEQVHVDGTTLRLTGHRGGLIFSPASSSKPAQLDFVEFSPEVHIRIAEDPSHPEALESVTNKIFASSLADAVADKTPELRQSALESMAEIAPLPAGATKGTPPPGPQSASTLNSAKTSALKIGKNVTPPSVLYSVPPPPSGTASSVCVVSLIVDQTGFPTRIRVLRSLGPAQDKAAVVAVSQYRFAPAVYENHPVPVEVNIEIDFRNPLGSPISAAR
jgi:hypothetical protein